MIRRRGRVSVVVLAVASLLAPSVAHAQRETDPLEFTGSGHTVHGDWRATVTLVRSEWRDGGLVEIDLTLRFSDTHLASLASAGVKADRVCVLATAERTFDADGWMRLPSDERMSTLLTPAGLGIEGGVQGAVTNRYGYQFKSPLDQFASAPIGQSEPDTEPGTRRMRFALKAGLPDALPPGLYRLRIDVGVMAGTRLYNFNGYTFAQRPFSSEAGTSTYFYSPIIPASARRVTGEYVDARRITARFPWLLLSTYNSNGYRGVVADEDRGRFATSERSLIPDEVILPLVDDAGNRLSYSLEPQFPADGIDPLQNIPWDWSSGELTVEITAPDGSQTTHGPSRLVARSGNGPTTRLPALTAWKPPTYGRYTVRATGWIADPQGRRYEGGGTYRFWIAKRMTLATATFQGMPYPVGSTYGRDIQFNPPMPADVQVSARLFVDSSADNVRSLSYSGKATTAGLFGAAQGMKGFPLDAAGEYHAQVLATYTDAEGHLWVCTMRHAGIVYPEASPVVARGKKFAVNGKYVDRGDTHFEGHLEANGASHLAHLTFPYQAGDVLLIAPEGVGANKIEPVLTYQMQGDASAWDTSLNGVGISNLRIRTSNGYSPHLYPEYITDLEYYYGAAPRPGFMGRFIVGESNIRAPYWSLSPNGFGGQIGASPNGDTLGDIYRLIGGVVIRRAGQPPMYSGYIASAFMLPAGTNNNRVIAAGSEDLIGPLRTKARFFLVGLRPGTAYEVGSTFRPAMQIDPILPVAITFELTYPDGRTRVAQGTGDRFGSFAGPATWALDVPGVYRYRVRGTWNGYEGGMPGLPDSGGEFFVYPKTRPAGSAGLRIDGATQRAFAAGTGTTVSGTSTASNVRYTMITPGAVIEQGELPVTNGRFHLVFDPARVHAKVPLYDVVSITTGKPQIGRVIHLTFFSEERSTGGSTYFDFARVILRGTTAISARATIPVAASPGDLTAADPAGAAREPVAQRVVATTAAEWAALEASVRASIADGDLRVVTRELDTVLPGRSHERLQQFHLGVPVVGGTMTRQLEAGQVVSLFGTLYRDIGVDPVPGLDGDEARSLIERRTGGWVSREEPPDLVILPTDAGRFALAWRGQARTGTDVRLCFVDAKTGAWLLDYSNLKAQAAMQATAVGVLGDRKVIGVAPRLGGTVAVDARRASTVTTFDLRGDLRRTIEALRGSAPLGPSDVAWSATGAFDPVVTDAQAHMGATLDYLAARFGRRGLDGHDGPVAAVVHAVRAEDWTPAGHQGWFHTRSAWDGRVAILGEGLPATARAEGRTWLASAAALDLVAHELAHGLIDASSGLINRGEAGALAEGFADVIATGAEFHAHAAGDAEHRADYLIGEDAVSGGGLRSLKTPPAGAPDARGAAERAGLEVHADAGRVGHAFYLAVEGDASAGVTGVGAAKRSRIEQAFFRAFVYLLPSDATFGMARAATVSAAREMFGAASGEVRAITDAWTAAGVR